MAVAGFSQEDLEVELKEGVLTIRSKSEKKKKNICIVELPREILTEFHTF
ncbi:MAG: hypothetical protein CM1200mP30_06570 [Pseudomonadota bacterium]|nr:MAG: hypothetical protein CM1200mP30_06570 [Pseudomonadota bacterium]